MASPKTIARLEAQIHRRAAHCLQHEVADPRLGFVTITKVELSTDMAVAKIHYSVLGDGSDRSKVEHLMQHARGFVQRQVASILRIRRAPQVRWVYDSTIEEAARMTQFIREVRERDAEINPDLELEQPEGQAAPPGAFDPDGPDEFTGAESDAD